MIFVKKYSGCRVETIALDSTNVTIWTKMRVPRTYLRVMSIVIDVGSFDLDAENSEKVQNIPKSVSKMLKN